MGQVLGIGMSQEQKILVDLIVPNWNRLDLLKHCVESVFKHTRIPSRLIIVDDGSTDQNVHQYLDHISGTQSVLVKVLRLQKNETLAKVINAGFKASEAPWTCLLNNDILVTEGWLEEMLAVAKSDDGIGLVNPMSNEFDVLPRPGESIGALARRRRTYPTDKIENWMCTGFCMLMPRRILKEVGYWDEKYKLFYFEDADYALKVRRAGYRCVIAERAFVFHEGGATVKTVMNTASRTGLFSENEKRFFKKWQLEVPQRIAYVITGQAERKGIYDEIRTLANRGHQVWVFALALEVSQLPRHIQVVPVRIARGLYAVSVLWTLFTKKKRFHRIITVDSNWTSFLGMLRALHRASVERTQTSGQAGHKVYEGVNA